MGITPFEKMAGNLLGEFMLPSIFIFIQETLGITYKLHEEELFKMVTGGYVS
ncbi:MAG: hypothetical protein ACOC44_13920 [Promethearchaeia archaeon]